MADIIDLIRADQLHIMLWQAELGDLRRQGSGSLAGTWDTLAGLIELHLAAEDEIVLGPAVDAAAAVDAHEDIREIIRETRLQVPGSPLWWRLTTAVLVAWAEELGRQERGILAGLRRSDPADRERLARQWRAFMEARIRDQIPHPRPQVATCQLRRTNSAAALQVAALAFDPVYCTCAACDDILDRVFPAPVRARRHLGSARFLRGRRAGHHRS
jgi:hypothetical protein